MGTRFQERTLEELTIEDESSFRHVALYGALKSELHRARHVFRSMPADTPRWDRALFLNLTFWGANPAGGDVLVDEVIPADVIAHAAWHHLAAKAFPSGVEAPSRDALFFGEAIASAFDVYLVGRLMGHARASTFLETQVPAMRDAAAGAGLSDDEFGTLLERIVDDPERAFEELRQLLFDAACTLADCVDAEGALSALASFDERPFGSLLHHYELSNWVLYARAYASAARDERVRDVDRALREANVSLEWLEENWIGR